MGYCTPEDLMELYGEDRITAWSRVNPDTVVKAISDASAEIDGYLLSGGYRVPMPGPPETVRKFCIDIACAGLVVSAGVLENDPGGEAVREQAKVARRFLEKVAEGKFRIPGYVGSESGETVGQPAGNVMVSRRRRFCWKGY